jgi:NitT/TauT family transport system substrate-binding protein
MALSPRISALRRHISARAIVHGFTYLDPKNSPGAKMVARNQKWALSVFALVLAAVALYVVRTRHESAPVASAVRPITMQLNWLPDGGHTYLFFGLEEGIFRRHGFDLRIQNGRGSGLSARLLAAGQADVALVGADALVAAIERGADIRSIGVIYEKSPVVVYSMAAKGIKTLQDLYGKRLGLTPAADSLLQYEGVMKLNGFDRSKIAEVAVDAVAAPSLLIQGKIDALLEYSYHSPISARLQGFEINEIPLSAYGDDIFGMTMAIRPGTFSVKELENLRAAVRESFWAAINDPDKAVGDLEKHIAPGTYEVGKTQAVELEKLAFAAVRKLACGDAEDIKCSRFFANDTLGWEHTIKTLYTFGIIGKEVPLATVVIN